MRRCSPRPPGSPRHKFVALRAAFARLALADQRFRRQRTLSDQERQDIAAAYDAAVRLVQERGVAPDNPLGRQVELHASRQEANLQSGLNHLRRWDAFVPVQRYSKLEELAEKLIGDAITSAGDFQKFLEQAEQEAERQMDVRFQQDQEERSRVALGLRRANATLSVDEITEQMRAIDDQRDFLIPGAVLGGFRALVDGAAAGRKPGHPLLGLATGVVGLEGTLVNFLDQRQQLAHQKRMAELEREIAENEGRIAEVEIELSQRRIEFYTQKLAFLGNRCLNADLLYTLAELTEKRAERQLEGAISLAYLFEWAVAFFLGEADIRHIQFDYLDRPGGIFDAAKALQEDFRLVQGKFAKITEEKFSDFEETISLSESYPIQFSRFLQTGEMDFVYSLYQLSKCRPAIHQCRLFDVGVEVVGALPTTGFSGTLTHMGRFLVRDKTAALRDPAATRLVPTEEQLAQALEEQRRQRSPVAAVGGVLYYDLEPDTKELSLRTQFVKPAPEQFTRDLIEGFRPTGLWRLEIRDHGRLDIADIKLHFAIIHRESDPFALQPKVEVLIRSYEAELAEGDRLDRISAFSLRQHFPDTFSALEAGPAVLTLGGKISPAG
jgi:hypothetical protein